VNLGTRGVIHNHDESALKERAYLLDSIEIDQCGPGYTKELLCRQAGFEFGNLKANREGFVRGEGSRDAFFDLEKHDIRWSQEQEPVSLSHYNLP
jgi:hypothetical protein